MSTPKKGNNNSNVSIKANGKKVKELRTAMRVPMKQAAPNIGISYDKLSAIESGKNSNCTADVILKLANYFDVSIDYLVDRDDPREDDYIETHYRNFARIREQVAYTNYLREKKQSSKAKKDDNVIAPWPYNLIEVILYGGPSWSVNTSIKKHFDRELTEEQKQGLYEALGKLPDNQLKVVRLYFKRGRSFDYIGGKMNLSKDEVKHLLYKSVRTLQHPGNRNSILNGKEE